VHIYGLGRSCKQNRFYFSLKNIEAAALNYLADPSRFCEQLRNQDLSWVRWFDLVEVFSSDRGSSWPQVGELSRAWIASSVSRLLYQSYCHCQVGEI
jgi:hypothetical protein